MAEVPFDQRLGSTGLLTNRRQTQPAASKPAPSNDQLGAALGIAQATGQARYYGAPAPTATGQSIQNAYNASAPALQSSGNITQNQQQFSYNPQAAAIAAEAARVAQEETTRQQLRGGISNLINRALGVYDTLFGNVRGAAASQRQALEEKYNTEATGLGEQFTSELPQIGKAYAARGAYDSSFRTGAEGKAQQGFERQLQGLQAGKMADMAKVGQELAAQEGQIGTQRSLLELTRGQLGEVSDINELRNLQNDINRRIAEVEGQAAGVGTREAYMQKFGQIAPAANRLGELQTQLRNIIQGEAPVPLKKSVINQIIGSSGLSEEEQAQINAQVNQMIG